MTALIPPVAPSELAALAREARQALDAARSATLLMPGGAACRDSVLLHQHNGTPVLICERNSAVTLAAWATERAVLAVTSSADDMVLFAGRLVIEDETVESGAHQASGDLPDCVEIVELHLESVRIGTPADPSAPQLPLELYFAASGAP